AFQELLYRVRTPEIRSTDIDVPITQIVAYDRDSGPNAELEYTIRITKGNGRFRVDPSTAVIYAQSNLSIGQDNELTVKAEDYGNPRKSATTRIMIEVVPRPATSKNSPVISSPSPKIQVLESEAPGYLVALVAAEDADDDDILWYS